MSVSVRRADRANCTVLLVEDDPGDDFLVGEMLRGRWGLEVSTVATVGEALATMASVSPDCVLLNQSLPGAGGAAAVRELHGALPQIPIIVLTGLGDEKRGLEAIQAGAHGYVVKDRIGGRDLAGVIRDAIERDRVSHKAARSTAASEGRTARRRRSIGWAAVGVATITTAVLAGAIALARSPVSVLEVLFAAGLGLVGVTVTLRWALAAGRVRRPVGQADAAIAGIDLADGTIAAWNQAAARLFGYSAGEALGKEFGFLVPEGLRGEADRAVEAVREGSEVTLETRRLHSDGREIDVVLTLTPVVDQSGAVRGVSALVAPRDEAVAALSRAEERFRGAFKHAPAGMGIVSIDRGSYGRLLQVNPALCELAGRGEADLLTMNLMEILDKDGPAPDSGALIGLLNGSRDTYDVEKQIKRGDGEVGWVQVGASMIRDDQGKPLYGLGQVHDITARKLAQEAQSHLAAIVESSIDAIIATDSNRQITAWNTGAELLFGYSKAAVIGRDFATLVPAELRDQERVLVDTAMAGRASDPHNTLMRKLDGSVIEVSLCTSPILGEAGETIGASAIARDITRETAGAAVLHASEKRLRQIVETANEGIWTLDDSWNTTFANTKMAEILGTTVDEMLGSRVFDHVAEHDREAARQHLALRSDGLADQMELRMRRADGAEVWTLMSAGALFGPDGKPSGALAMVADITERRTAERELRQFQRLEGLGQLAGGVAHDMNNLLGVILNFADFGLDGVGDGPGREELTEIRQAAERAAVLTRQLLVFASQEEVRSEAFDLNALLDGIEKLLQRTIGEHIALSSHHGSGLPPISADPGLIEQAVLNLVVNARDALPDGGLVTITTGLLNGAEDEAGPFGDLSAGDYVCLHVSDNGEGMTEEVASRAFDPFFTTKPAGSGTGLGLATVYGAITKAGGRVRLSSELGEGTEVTVCLPVARAERPRAEALAEPPAAPPALGTVLVVEDDRGLRKVTVRILEAHGYDVLAASGPAEGLEIARSPAHDIGLVIADVVMPEMSGPEMAEQLEELHPGLPVIFVSGYTHRSDDLPEGAFFLGKPFTRVELLREVASAWRAPARSPSAS